MPRDSIRRQPAVRSRRVRPAVRDLAIVLGVSWLARGLFVAAIGDAQSSDVGHWIGALEAQDQGRNPYETGVLNWPPLWLVVIVALDYAANVVDVAFWTALRVYLVLVESAIAVTLYLALVAHGVERRAVRTALLVGIAVNPVAILLVSQHGNSDVQVGLVVTLAVIALAAYARSRDVLMWLAGCLFLGLGVLAKTAPLVLAPLLAPGARLTSRVGRALGAALVLGPAALGIGVIAVLVPVAVWDHVISYRSTRGFFGIGGILEELLGVEIAWYERLFTLVVLVAVVWLFVRLWRVAPLGLPTLFLLVAVVFMAVIALGPGYGAQYAYWFIPALIGTYVLLDRGWQRILLAAYAIGAVTYAVEYAFVPFLGAWLPAAIGETDWTADAGEWLGDPQHLVLFRLPLFAAYLVVLVAGVRRLSAPERYDAKL